MTSPNLRQVSEKLSVTSTKAHPNPSAALPWPETMNRCQWFMSPELISIYKTPVWESLSEEQKMELSFWEAVNYFSLNIYGEKEVVQGVNTRLFTEKLGDFQEFCHHFIDEENKHMQYFGTFCKRYAGKIYLPSETATPQIRDELGLDDFLFFAKILIFEEMSDYFNREMMNDARLHPIAREINRMHHMDEIRHIAYGKSVVAYLYQTYSPGWGTEKITESRRYLQSFQEAAWQEYFNPEVYKDAHVAAGVSAFKLAQQAQRHPESAARKQKAISRLTTFLTNESIF